MDRYSRAKIYRLVGGGKTYYGSTCLSLAKRMAYHRSDYKRFIAGNYNKVSSFEIMNEPDVVIVLVEEYPCSNKEQLLARERYWIENNECINKNAPIRTTLEKKERYDRMLEQRREKTKERELESYIRTKISIMFNED